MYAAAHSDIDRVLVEVYGVLMFLSAMSLTVYVCLALTVMYPLLESIPDFAALEAFQSLGKHWGGYELFLFNFGEYTAIRLITSTPYFAFFATSGCQAVLVAMMVAAKVVYSMNVLYIILAIFAVLYRYICCYSFCRLHAMIVHTDCVFVLFQVSLPS